jgi:hypothetical protein
MASLAQREPAVVTGGIMGAFGALVTVLAAFHIVHLDAEQAGALAGLAVIVLPPLQGFITRQFVRPVHLSTPLVPPGGSLSVPPD